MKNKWLFIAGLSGFLCVTIGAFAAHGLSKVLEPKELAWIETGVKYQMFHTIAILAIGILQLCREALVVNKMANLAAGTWAYGILLFSGSLYALALWCRQIPRLGDSDWRHAIFNWLALLGLRWF